MKMAVITNLLTSLLDPLMKRHLHNVSTMAMPPLNVHLNVAKYTGNNALEILKRTTTSLAAVSASAPRISIESFQRTIGQKKVMYLFEILHRN
jgi:hypothetical protein